jgi:hypothetical protein
MDLIPVTFRDCACPGTPHPDGDVAYLRPYLDYPGGAEALRAIGDTQDDGLDHFREYVNPVLIRRGVVSWNLLDADGLPVPVTREALDELRWEDAYLLGEKAQDTYGDQILAPLVKAISTSLQDGQTEPSTPTPLKPSATAPKRSASSSSPS